MFDFGWTEGGEAWKWRHNLWAWEEELLVECRSLLLIVVLQVDVEDTWTWTCPLFLMLLRYLRISYAGKMSPLRSRFLLRDSFKIGCLRRRIYSGGV